LFCGHDDDDDDLRLLCCAKVMWVLMVKDLEVRIVYLGSKKNESYGVDNVAIYTYSKFHAHLRWDENWSSLGMPFVRYNCQPILLAFERTRDLLISRFRLNNMECSQTMSEIQSTYSSRLNHHCSHEYVQVQPQPRQPNNDDALLQSLVSATIRTVLVKEKQKASIDLSNFN